MMKLFRYILLVLFFLISSRGFCQIPNNKLCPSGINSSVGQFVFCSGDSINIYYNPGTPNTHTFYQWMTGNYPALVSISGQTNATLSVKNGGDYYLRVIDTLGVDDTCFRVQTVTVNPKPNATFTFPSITGCGKTEIQFTNATQTITNLQYIWNMGDPTGANNTPNTANPSHIYIPSASGTAQSYTISLTLKDGNTNCSSSYSQTISIGAGPDAKLNETNTTQYEGKLSFVKCSGIINFNFPFTVNTSTPVGNILKYRITWGDLSPDSVFTAMNNNFSFNHTYSRGLYNLRFSIEGTNGCTNYKDYFVFLGNTPSIGLPVPLNIEICSEDKLVFLITNYSGNPPGTTYSIHFSDTNTDTTFNHPPPDSIIHTFNNSSCGFTDLKGNANSFYVNITAKNPCNPRSQDVSQILVYKKPKAKFSISPYDTTCIGENISINNTSNFSVFPLSTSNCNSANIVWKIIPSNGWSKTSGSFGNDNSYDTDPSSWTTGSANLGITFANAGTYTIIQKIGNNSTCQFDSIIKTICVNPTPTSSFSLTKSTICLGDTATAKSSASTPLCGKTTYQWTITYAPINGCIPSTSNVVYTIGSDTSANPQFRFNNPGTYTISLVTGIKGITCTSTSSSQTITVKGKPNISINVIASVCQGENITPTAAAPTCYVSFATYNWAFAGGIPATANTLNPGTIKMDSAGNKTVSLIATNECGTTTTQATVTIKPIPAIGSAIPHNPSQCTFTNGSIDLTGLINGTTYTITYTKNGGDTITITKVAASGMVTITGLGSGVYDNIKVAIVGDGCFSNPVGPISLSDPNPPATPTVGSNAPLCSGATLNLTSSTTTTGAITYSWSGPNGFSSSAQNPIKSNVTVAATGTYSVTATLAGCTSAAGTVAVTVNQTPATPTVSYNNPICSGATLNLTSNTTTTGTINYVWTGPNSFTSATQNPSITGVTTAASGNYNVIATATPSNCASSAGTLNVTVNQTPNISNSSATNPSNCSGNDGKIILEGLAFNTSYLVVYTKGATTITPISLSSNASGILTITGLAAGTYTSVSVSLNGCPSNVVGPFILADPNPPVTPTITAVANICSGKNLTLSAITSSSGTATYNWSGPNGFTATGTPININNIPTKLGGTYNVTATISGCTSSAGTATITVDSTPATPTITGNTTICSDSTLKLTASTASSGAMTYNWTGPNSYANNTSSITINNIVTSNAGTYNVTATSNAGCISSIGTTNVIVNITPVISNINSANPAQCASATGFISFNIIPATGTYTVNYIKNGVNKSVSINAASGIIKIDTLRAGTYSNITVTLNNCPSNALGPITLSDPNPPPTPVIVGVDSICSGKNLVLNPTTLITNGVYTWTHPNGNTTIGNTYTLNNISTQDFGVYKLSVTLNLCKSNDATFTVRVDSTPVAPVLTSNSPKCTDSTIKLFAATTYPMAVTYSWTGANSFTSIQQNPIISPATLLMSGSYNAVVTSVVGKCSSQIGTTNVVVNETPHIVFKDSTYPTQCATATGNIRLSGLKANTAYQITYTVGGNTFNQTQTSDGSGVLKIDTLRAGTYSNIFVTLNACPSNVIGSYTLVDPNPPAIPVIIGVDSICSGKNLTLTASTTSAGIATYDWTGPNGFVQNGTNGTIIINNIITNATATFTATATIAKCISAAVSKTVRVDSTPIASALASNSPVCTDSTIKLFATTAYPMAVTYSWTGATSFTSTQQNPTISTATLAMAGAYNATVTSVVGKCLSQVGTTNVVVNETPHISFKDSTNPNQCATPTGNIRLSGLKANTAYQITYTVGGNTFNQTQTSDGSGILKIDTLRAGTYSNIFVTLNACPSNTIGSYTLVDPNPPATPVIVGVDSICSQKNLILNPTTLITNGVYIWTHPNGNTTIGNTYTLNNISTQDFGVYKLSVTLNLCKSNDATFKVRVDSTPVAPLLTSNSPVCTDSAIKLFATTAYPMPVTYSWTGVNSFTSTQQDPTISNATLIMAGNYTATVTSVVGKCPSQVSTTNVVVNETPNVAQLNDTTYKDAANSSNIIFTGTVANTIFNWVNSNPAIGLAASSAGTINFNATNTTPFPIFGIVTVTPSTQFCVGKPMNFKITVNPTPTLSSKLKDTICTDNLYTYQATSVTPNVKYTWIRNAVSGISNAASSSTDSSGLIGETLINTTTQPIDVVYTFKLYSLGSVNSVPFVLTVNPNAKAVYTFANDKLCTPAFIDSANIKVQDFSNATYEWYANNILIGTGINFPGFPITNNGDTVYIKLKAISTFGCKPDSFEHKFYTVKTPTVLFTKSSAKGCGPLKVSFTNNSTPLNAPTYSWNFGNGQTSNLQTPNDVTFIADTSYNRHDTTYYITLTAYTQCDTIKFVDSVTVLPKPRALFQPDTTVGCSVFHFAAFNNSLGTHNTYTWDFGDSTALVIDTAYGYYYHNFKVTTTDTFNVKLKAENVCGVDSFTVNVVVFPNTIVPKLVVDGTNNFGCAPTNIRFINNTRGANRFIVNFGDGSLPYISTNNPDTIYHYYTTGGNYTATLKAQNSCTDSTVALTITLYNKPVASFSTLSSEYCKNDNIHFTNTSDTTLNRFWNFGDGITSTAIHPNHTYSSAGNYTITLIVKSTNASGAVCTDTATKNIIVHQIPSAAFTTNAVLQNCQPYLFEGVAPIINGYIYNWKFYDVSSIDTAKSGAVGTHTFYNTGTYNIRLIVFNSFGCSDTSFANVKVIETPKALFSLSDSLVCVPGKTINFTNKTTYSAADAINYEWYVDGIKQNSTTNFNYNFTVNPNITTAVTFSVKLIVTNSYGCKDSLVKKVMIQPKAKATFQIYARQGCAPFSLQVNNSSLYANIFKWYVDGNLVYVAASPSPFQLAQPNKNYIIKLVADHSLGCGADSTVLSFTTYPKPIADFQIPVTSSCSGVLNINCFDLSSVAGGSIKKWNWSFGDGKTDTIQNSSHSYNISGAFNVSLWVKDDKDCVSDVAFKTVKNFGKPKANFTVGNVCLGSDVVPVNLSTTGFGSTSITSYLWNFGDGTFLTGNQPIHKYNTEGVYTITLTITADSSCVADTITKTITIYGKPTASFGFSNNCVRQTTQFTNTSLFGFGQSSIGNSTWFFGDGLTSNVKDAQHIYAAASSYNVKLQVSGNRCPNLVDSITKIITINQPRSNMVYPRIEGTRGIPIQLNAANNGIVYQWLPSTALNNAFIQNPIANFAISSPNIVNYQIKITDSFGCVSTDKQEVWLFAGADIYLPTAFTPNGDNANDLFKPLYINIPKIQYFRVFDRWGKIVFETSDMSKSWDGTLTGKELPTDTYVWSIAGFTNDGAEIIRKGNVTLIRN